MFKTLIDGLNSKLTEDSKNIKSKIDELEIDFNQFKEKIDNQKKEIQDLPLPEETKNKLVGNLNSGLSKKKSEFEQAKSNLDNQLKELDEKTKAALELELDNAILRAEQKLKDIDNKLDDLNKKIDDATKAIDFTLISSLGIEIKSVFSGKEQIDKLLSNLNNLKKEFDINSFNGIVLKMERIENVDLESYEKTIDEFMDISIVSYDDIMFLSNDMESKLDELLKSDAETIINSNVMVDKITIEDYFEIAEKYRDYDLLVAVNNPIKTQLETITKKYEEYSKLKNLIIEIIKIDIDELKNSDIKTFYSKFVSTKLKIDNIDVKYQSVKQSLSKMLEVVKNEFKTSHKLGTQVNPDNDLDDDKNEIQKMINDLKNNKSNFSEQKYVDAARQILSKIESLEDKELKEDLKNQLKLVEFGSASSESNDNLNLEELKEKFKEKYSSIERAMLTDVVIEFDDIESLAAQFDDILTQSNAYEYIDDLKKLYKLSSTVSIKIKNDYITTDDEKEITNLLHEIRKISNVVYDGMYKQFEERKRQLESLEGSEIVSFFRKPTTTGTNENSEGFIIAGNSDDYEDIFTHPENNPGENERKKFKELEDKINHTAYNKLEDLRNEVEKVKESKGINEAEAAKLNLLISNIQVQLEEIKTTSEILIKKIGLIPLKKFVDKDEMQGMLDEFNKYVDNIKTIYEMVKSNPIDSVVAIKYNELVDTFVEFNNKVSTKFNIEKFRRKPGSRKWNCKYNNGDEIVRLSKERIEEKGNKKLFANTEKILNAKNTISELQVKIRLDGFDSLKSKIFDKTKDYNKAVNDICDDLIGMLNNEIRELEKDNFTLDPTKAFDSWILMLSIMPSSIGDYTRSDITELVAKYASMIKNVIEKSNDESLKKQLGKDNIDLDTWYSTIAAISLYKKEHDYFDFKDESAFDDDITLYADHSSVLYGIRYMDPEMKIMNLSK